MYGNNLLEDVKLTLVIFATWIG